ncbi:MAG: hypothetical protein UY83_C0010G0005 [Candidatus Adlerbacteria bacterium GW2011_GWA1_54_10]|uniref:DUF5666 domain-containing protein n=3 Tax=Candidatus Adleribacteriota TaxID=1752736 RepID=A0A1F4XZF4_9BACT|nr:MAG: hypothetical protein UY83_C0010G0005 [Candidatus Adlerbacteria bacterium GW2011_GWA1_54_10]KKW38032.1 MAG: hypothetical protein UY86_C0001G0005 [Candidatus Adlerbacteria bacterium GW2011_GWB1_54_7]OGC87059.1 MAG: hypothetical protein A3B33_00330 [Candidatus Adlerbacteria bacterium RIFCSPLOWO2_01_FULL_54_16]
MPAPQQIIKILAASFGVALAVIAVLMYFLLKGPLPAPAIGERTPPTDVPHYDSTVDKSIGGVVISVVDNQLTVGSGVQGSATINTTIRIDRNTILLRQTTKKDPAVYKKEMDAFLAKIDRLPQSSIVYIAPSMYVEENISLTDIKVGETVGVYAQPISGSQDMLATSVEVLLPPWK